MKKLFTFIVGAAVSLGAYAQDFDSGGLYYQVLSPDDHTCKVTGYYDVGSVLEIPDNVSFEGEEYTVTEIGNWAITSRGINELILPSTLEVIGDYAFYNSYSLNEIVIPNSVKELGNSCFGYSYNLNRVELGTSLEVIGNGAFTECRTNVVVALGETPAQFTDGFHNSFSSNPLVAVDESLVSAYQAAWAGADVVPNIPAESISFEPTEYSVQPGKSVQLNCVVSPANAPIKFSSNDPDVITVDQNGLVTADPLKGDYWVNVTATSLNGLTATCEIRTESLERFESDGYVYTVIPDTDNEVAMTRWESNDAVVNIPENVEYNGNVYSVTAIGANTFSWKENIEEVNIPASIKLIKEENFNYCNSLTKVTIADSDLPLELSNCNFTDDSNLNDLYIGRNLEYSDNSTCFRWIDKLSHLVIGPEVTSLRAEMFVGCGNLSLVESKNPVPPTIGYDALGYGSLSIIVPAESTEAYQEAWEQYASCIIAVVDATSLSFDVNELTIYNGQYLKLPLTVEPEDATVVWSSSNPDLVRVDKEGNIEYYRWTTEVGEAVITASTLNGLTAECTVTAKHWLTFSENFSIDNKLSLAPGDDYQVEVTKPEELAEAQIIWDSSNVEVVTVDESGLITAVAPGNAEIVAVVEVPDMGTFNYSIPVEVRSEPTAVIAVEPEISVWKDYGYTPIDLTFEPADDPSINRSMTWTYNPEFVEVFENGENNYAVRGLNAGTTTITGTTVNGLNVDIEVIVKAPVDRVIFPTDRLYIAPGTSKELEFTTEPEVTNVTLNYISPDPEIVSVDENGVITGHNIGVTEIGVEAETPWGYTNTWWQRVEVCNLPETVAFVGSSDYVGAVNEWTQLQIEFTPNDDDICREIQWTVDNHEIAYIEPANNSFYCYKLGSTGFRGVAANGDVLEGTITVQGIMTVVDGVETTGKNVNLGDEFRIDINASSDELLQHVTYTSYEPQVATVTEEGIVTAVGYGTATINVTSSVEVGENEPKYYNAYFSVTVMPAEGITFNRTNVTLTPGGWEYLNVIRAENVGYTDLNWQSSDENVVAINWSNSEQAEITYVGTGTAVVTATDAYGNVATCEVTCVANIEDLTFNTDKILLAPGRTFQLEYTTVPEMTGQTFRFDSENPEIATVDPETGIVTGVDYGNTYIYVSASNDWRRWSVPVEVCMFPESVKFAGSSDYEGTLNNWTWFQLEFTPDNPEVCKTIEWTDYDTDIVFIDTDNSFIGRNFGTTPFRGVAVNGDVLEGTITIKGIKTLVDGEETRRKDVNLGSVFKIDVETYPADLSENLTFTSNNTEIATVTEDGTVTAVGYGSTSIRVRATVEVGENEWKTYEANIAISVMPDNGIAFSSNKVTLYPNNVAYISIIRAQDVDATEVTWNSSNEDVVSFEWRNQEEAALRYVGPGIATVTATDIYGNVATCEVTCMARVEGLTFNTQKVYVAPGGTYQLDYTTIPEETFQTIRLESGNTDIATVDSETRVVTGVSYGDTEIYAYDTNWNWLGSVPVKVCNLPESVKLVGDTNYEGTIDNWTWLDIEFTPNDDDVCREIQWTVENLEIGYIDRYNNAFYGRSLGETAFRGVAANGDVLDGTITIKGIMAVVDGEEYKEVELGEEIQLEIEASSEDLLEQLHYYSENPEVATVDDQGVVTAVGPGRTNIIVTTSTIGRNREVLNYEARFEITVRPSEGFVFNTKNTTLKPYGWEYLSVIRAENDEWSNLTWESSNPNVVSINWYNDYQAEIGYVNPGIATVTATDEYNNSYSCEVKCIANVNWSYFNTNKVVVEQEGTFQLEFTTYPYETYQTITFESGNPAVATVDPETGLVTGVAYGSTDIYAKGDFGYINSVPVVVCQLPESVKFAEGNEFKGNLDEWIPLHVEFTPDNENVYKEITWSYSNPYIGHIEARDNNYAFYGTNLGTTTFRGVTYNGLVLNGTVTITSSEIQGDKLEILVDGQATSAATMLIGDELQLDVDATSPELLENVTFSSDDPEVVTVDKDGKLTAVAYGTTTVWAESRVKVGKKEWKTYEAPIEITVDFRKGITFDQTDIILNPEGLETINVNRELNVEFAHLNWKSSDEDVVSFLWSNDYNATVVYKGAGEAIVTATDKNGYGAVCKVTCSGITFTESEVEMSTNSSLQLDLNVFPANADVNIIWTSQDPRMVRVDENGVITSNSLTGSTQITAMAYINGYYSEAVCEVSVAGATPVTSITLDQTTIAGEIGEQFQLTATVDPDDASNPALYWESSDENVATVDQDGLVTIVADGTAVIYVYAAENHDIFATCLVYCTSGVAGVEAEETFDIYNTNGILVKKNATAEDYERLEPGIYLIKKGDKVIKVMH